MGLCCRSRSHPRARRQILLQNSRQMPESDSASDSAHTGEIVLALPWLRRTRTGIVGRTSARGARRCKANAHHILQQVVGMRSVNAPVSCSAMDNANTSTTHHRGRIFTLISTTPFLVELLQPPCTLLAVVSACEVECCPSALIPNTPLRYWLATTAAGILSRQDKTRRKGGGGCDTYPGEEACQPSS